MKDVILIRYFKRSNQRSIITCICELTVFPQQVLIQKFRNFMTLLPDA